MIDRIYEINGTYMVRIDANGTHTIDDALDALWLHKDKATIKDITDIFWGNVRFSDNFSFYSEPLIGANDEEVALYVDKRTPLNYMCQSTITEILKRL